MSLRPETANFKVPVAHVPDAPQGLEPVRTWSRRVVADSVQMVIGVGALTSVGALASATGQLRLEPLTLVYFAVLIFALASVRLVPHRAPWQEPSRVRALPSIVRAMVMAGVVIAIATFVFTVLAPHAGLLPQKGFSVAPWSAGLAGALGAGLAKAVCGMGLSHPAFAQRLQRNIAIYGACPVGHRLYGEILKSRDLRFVGMFDDRKPTGRREDLGLHRVGGLQDLLDLIRADRIDAVAIALPPEAHERIADVSFKLQEYPVDVHLTLSSPTAASPADPAAGGASMSGDHVGDLTLIVTHRRAIRDWARIFKALEDRILGSLFLIVFAPLFLLIAGAIRWDSRGPVFFRQLRHGRAGAPFAVWKFRTMHVQEIGPEVPQATVNDPRVTRVGRFLRQTSLDELPQLLNVVAGSMSLVGPRPHAISHNAHYAALIEAYLARHQVKPGMTGLAQINGFRGETRTPDQMAQRVALDLAYISSWSLWLDFKIILLTPIYGLVHKNAY